MYYCEDCSSYHCGCAERKEIESLRQQVKLLRDAHKEISAIKDKMYGGDWDEIEEARDISNKVIDATEPKT